MINTITAYELHCDKCKCMYRDREQNDCFINEDVMQDCAQEDGWKKLVHVPKTNDRFEEYQVKHFCDTCSGEG